MKMNKNKGKGGKKLYKLFVTDASKKLEVAFIMGRQHVLVVPFPAQGHVGPLMKLSHIIADHGIQITFVNTEFIQTQIVAGIPDVNGGQSQIRLVSIPDGLDPGDDRKDVVKLTRSILRVMPGHLEELIENINRSNDDEKISCVIADTSTGWALEVAEKMEIERVAFWPAGPGSLAMVLHVPKLIEAGIIDNDGTTIKDELINFSNEIPALTSNEFTWRFPGDSEIQKTLFGIGLAIIQAVKLSNWLLCNTFFELDSSACNLIPNILPIGPLIASHHLGHSAGNLWPEDSTCLSWLDKQPAASVTYVAFGSIAIFNKHQFDEIALGLELMDRPFLWVVRADLMNGSLAEYPDGFKERIADRGKIVEWAPQEKVLAHPSIGCFLTHCGWNSTLEGLSMGVPFLCWPYFGDQFFNKSYICDIWKVGIWMNPDDIGIISRQQLKEKLEMLLADDDIKANARKLKEMARKSVNEGGSSLKNFETFLEKIKCQ